MNTLNSRDENVCSYTGFFGIAISAICLIQHFIVTYPGWISALMALIYTFSIVSFTLLALQKPVASILLIIVTALSLVSQIILLRNGLLSVIVLLLCIYTMAITIYIYVDGIPGRLMQKATARRQEREQWRGKI